MALRIGVVSQKGGVGKSTLCRMIACEYARAGWEVKIADMDSSQGTSYNWHSRRIEHGVEPLVAVEMFSNIAKAIRIAPNYDLLVFDGAPHSTRITLQIAKECELVILPTGISLDDLQPTLRLAQELTQNGISIKKIVIALCRVGDSRIELQEAIDYIKSAPFLLLDGSIPERTVYRRASDIGRAATETTHTSTNQRAGKLMQSIVTHMTMLTQQEEAT